MKKILVKKYRFGRDITIYCDITTFKEIIQKINYRVRLAASSPVNYHIYCGKNEINFIICNSDVTF